MSESDSLVRLCDDLISWYWTFGIQRTGRYALPRGTWLDQVLRVHRTASMISQSLADGKGCMGIWGPSQSGKSTLISSCIDPSPDQGGASSALDWPGGTPIRFASDGASGAGQALSLNPYNHQADASGCVSRYIVQEDEEIEDPKYPVEVKIASSAEVMHALAAGYLSECKNNNQRGETVTLGIEDFVAKLDDLRDAQLTPRIQKTFEAVYELADVLELLIQGGSSRYANLNAGGVWERSLRKALLDCQPLLESEKNVREFTAELLWDAKPSITRTFEQLTLRSNELSTDWSGCRVYCSMEVAALLLDIAAFENLGKTDTGVGRMGKRPLVERYRKVFKELSWDRTGSRINIGAGYPNKLCNTEVDFGIFQALVWELVIPLRRKVLADRSPTFLKFLEIADLLDFPGVGLAHDNVEGALIDADGLPHTDQHKLLTHVFKRGKTASIVARYAKGLRIDAFSLLVKYGTFPAKPRELHAGILAWWKYFDPSYDPHKKPRDVPPLPLNLVLTFCNKLINDVAGSGVRGGLEPSFGEMLGKLDVLADPAVVTTFATTSPKFGGFSVPLSKVSEAQLEIEQDAAFRRHFATDVSLQSFRHLLDEDGGTNNLFKALQSQWRSGRRQELLGERQRWCIATIIQLLEEAKPSRQNEAEKRDQAISSFAESVERFLQEAEPEGLEDGPAMCGRLIRQLLDIDPNVLDPVPLQAVNAQVKLDKYVREQYIKWITGHRFLGEMGPIGLLNQNAGVQMLHYLVEGADVSHISRWLRMNFGHLSSPRDARIARRYLAMLMANTLWYGTNHIRSHRQFEPLAHNDDQSAEGIRDLLITFANYERRELGSEGTSYKFSPHYIGIIEPFYDMLLRVKEGSGGTRPAQPGDSQIIVMSSRAQGVVGVLL